MSSAIATGKGAFGGPQASAALAEALRARKLDDFELALVLGSGLGAFAERLKIAQAVPFGALAGMPASAVPGHAGRFVLGEIAGKRVLVQQGRAHLYEGWSAEQVSRSVRACALLGCRTLVLTNAAGGLRREWGPGSLMRISDHINLQKRSPLQPGEGGLANPYDREFGARIDAAARARGLELRVGTYAAMLGPCYESPAEIRALAWMGADAVGMSTVCEAVAGRAGGMRVAAFSCITNLAAGIGGAPLSHDEVVATGKSAAERFCQLLELAIAAA